MKNESEKLGDNLIKNSHVEGGDMLMTNDKIKINQEEELTLEFMQTVFDNCKYGDTHSSVAIKELFMALHKCGFGSVCGSLDNRYSAGVKAILNSPKMTRMMCMAVDTDRYNKIQSNLLDNEYLKDNFELE
tara:strand:- start:2147 stop:2539 length:393 start_codon:yes stop_codon:yes gene_type:complete